MDTRKRCSACTKKAMSASGRTSSTLHRAGGNGMEPDTGVAGGRQGRAHTCQACTRMIRGVMTLASQRPHAPPAQRGGGFHQAPAWPSFAPARFFDLPPLMAVSARPHPTASPSCPVPPAIAPLLVL